MPQGGDARGAPRGLARGDQPLLVAGGLLAATAYHAAFGAVVVLIDVIAVRDLGGPTALGWISAAAGAGGLLGGLLALRLPPTRPLFVGWPCVALMSLFAAAFAWPGTLSW